MPLPAGLGEPGARVACSAYLTVTDNPRPYAPSEMVPTKIPSVLQRGVFCPVPKPCFPKVQNPKGGVSWPVWAPAGLFRREVRGCDHATGWDFSV